MKHRRYVVMTFPITSPNYRDPLSLAACTRESGRASKCPSCSPTAYARSHAKHRRAA